MYHDVLGFGGVAPYSRSLSTGQIYDIHEERQRQLDGWAPDLVFDDWVKCKISSCQESNPLKE